MSIPVLPSHDFPDTLARPVVGLKVELAFAGETEPHKHRKDQLLYVIEGLITVEAAQGVWTVPPQCAIWIPSGVPHFARATGQVSIGNLYVEPDESRGQRADCGILFVQPLLRELILRFVNEPHSSSDGNIREARLASVLMDELERAPVEPLRLPMPADRRLKRLADTLLDDPSLRLNLEEWGARVGASNRTLTRLFQRETGMSLGRWRQQLHVGLALQRLADGESVTNIAIDLGYESPSAFIAMFRRMLGTTPARYLTETATDMSSGGKGDVIHICGDRSPLNQAKPADQVVRLSRRRGTN
ncbi:AraC family transcriptional regulator [Ochrobactrum quorumnocens]|uniref:AraC family transcriptional regulator n=1 Tax=Ochrobactrum quorumnocens TaxID=271865 RepID=UPI000A42F924